MACLNMGSNMEHIIFDQCQFTNSFDPVTSWAESCNAHALSMISCEINEEQTTNLVKHYILSGSFPELRKVELPKFDPTIMQDLFKL